VAVAAAAAAAVTAAAAAAVAAAATLAAEEEVAAGMQNFRTKWFTGSVLYVRRVRERLCLRLLVHGNASVRR